MNATTIWHVLQHAAQRHGDRPALVTPSGQHTYAELYDRAARLGTSLRATGLDEGDRVAVVLRNVPEYVEILLGAAGAGLVSVPINHRASSTDVAHCVRDAGAKALITSLEFAERTALAADAVEVVAIVGDAGGADGGRSYERLLKLGDASLDAPPVPSEARQAVYYTSGTTAGPKGVVRSHGADMAMALGATAALPGDETDAWMYAIPMHSAAFYSLALPALLVGGRLVLLGGGFDASLFVAVMHREGVTHALLVPTMWEMVMRSVKGGAPLPALRHALWGGMPMLESTARRLAQWLPVPCLGSYGLTEATGATISTPEVYRSGRWESAGYPILGMEARVVDDDGRDVATGVYGEVVLRGSVVMTEYLNRPGLTARTLVDGWLHTGDLGRLDDDGALSVIDRKKDMIISGGENIYPAEVEGVIAALDGVIEVAVVGAPDHIWGQAVHAFVVSDGTISERDVIERCSKSLAAYKKPRRVVLVDELPKNALGKIVKHELLGS